MFQQTYFYNILTQKNIPSLWYYTTIISKSTMKSWRILESTAILKSKWLSLYNHTYELPNGKIGKDYYHINKPNYTLIVAVNDKNEIVLEKNYRRGVKRVLIELPAGYINKGETARHSAKRELKEETGYECRTILVKKIYPTPSFCSMKAFVVLAKITSNIPSATHLEKDEQIKVFTAGIDEINSMIQNGKIRDMGMISAIKLVEPLLKKL